MRGQKNRRVSLALAIALVAVVYGYLVVPAVRRNWSEFQLDRSSRRQARFGPFRGGMRFESGIQQLPGWTFTADGPVLTEGFVSRLQLQSDQVLLANAILKVAFQEYLQLEREHSQQEHTQDGHLVTTISSFPTAELEQRFWSKLDQVLSESQQSRARESLARPSANDTAARGLFGWSGEAATIETWQDGNTYYWTIRAGDASHSHSRPEPPADLRRFWAM